MARIRRTPTQVLRKEGENGNSEATPYDLASVLARWNARWILLTVFRQHGARLEEGNDARILLERTGDLFPRDELGHLLRQLPELLEVDVTVWQSETRNCA